MVTVGLLPTPMKVAPGVPAGTVQVMAVSDAPVITPEPPETPYRV